AQLIQDARRHGVQVLPADVAVSSWDAALETAYDTKTQTPASRPAVRLGLNQIQGFSEAAARRIENARLIRPSEHTQDLARRADLNRHELDALAAVDALHHLAGHCRLASWEASATLASRDLLRHADVKDTETP